MATVNWEQLGGGLFNAGLGMWGASQAEEEAKKRLQSTRGPMYDQIVAQSQSVLNQGASFDPKQFARERCARLVGDSRSSPDGDVGHRRASKPG